MIEKRGDGPYFRLGVPPLHALKHCRKPQTFSSIWCLASSRLGVVWAFFTILKLFQMKIVTSWDVVQLGHKATILKMWGWVLVGCGQQRLSEPSCPNSEEDKCKARPDWGQGVAWQGCHGDGAGLDREGMLNEAIVWPKWSTPHKEWHIQTVIQAHCCGGPAERCRSAVYPTESTTHQTQRQRELDLRTWSPDSSRKQYWPGGTFETLQWLLDQCKHHWTGPTENGCSSSPLELQCFVLSSGGNT